MKQPSYDSQWKAYLRQVMGLYFEWKAGTITAEDFAENIGRVMGNVTNWMASIGLKPSGKRVKEY